MTDSEEGEVSDGEGTEEGEVREGEEGRYEEEYETLLEEETLLKRLMETKERNGMERYTGEEKRAGFQETKEK